jgi:hypothetical protein
MREALRYLQNAKGILEKVPVLLLTPTMSLPFRGPDSVISKGGEHGDKVNQPPNFVTGLQPIPALD